MNKPLFSNSKLQRLEQTVQEMEQKLLNLQQRVDNVQEQVDNVQAEVNLKVDSAHERELEEYWQRRFAEGFSED